MAPSVDPAAAGIELPAPLTTPAKVIAGAEPQAIAAGSDGVLLLHGLTGSPWEMRPLADRMVGAGHSVAMPLLAGHGVSLEALARSRWQDWLASARASMTWLEDHCERVHLVGLSMGSLLALLLAGQRSRVPIASLTLMAPAFGLQLGQASALRVVRRIGWPRLLGKGPVDLHGGLEPPAFSAMPVAALRSLVELNEVIGDCRPLPTAPTLVLHGSADHTIPLWVGRRGARDLLGQGVSVQVVPGAGHLLPRTAAGNEVCAQVVQFVARHSAAAQR